MLTRELLTQISFSAKTAEETLEILETRENGLSEEEARERLGIFGKNTIHDGDKIEIPKILWNQFKSPLILILLLAGATTIMLKGVLDGIFIFAAVAVNVILGFYQEHKAETALESLRSYIKERTRVIRDGQEKEIDAESIAPGDVVRLRVGARVPADIRCIALTSLEVDESILTGESLPVEKETKKGEEETPVHERKNMCFGGTLVVNGMGLGVVVITGNATELGRIAALVGKEERETPLQRAIKRFSLRATFALSLFIGLLFLIGVWEGYAYFEMFLMAVAIAVSAVPEGLPVAMTVILAVGVERLAKRKGVVRKLLAAETLGRTTVILTDKTGTLTEGKMELTDILTQYEKEDVLTLAVLALDIEEHIPPEGPLEKAVKEAAKEYKIFLPDIRNNVEILEHKPFNSKDKWSGVRVAGPHHDTDEGWLMVGAPEVLAERIGAKASQKETIHKETDHLAREGGRVVGVAKGKMFLGLLVFKDPVRSGMREIIEKTTYAGIRTIILTGDHKGTALAVAKEVGLEAKEDEIITGEELKKMGDEELKARSKNARIFARISPEDKLRIAKIYQSQGEVVAMTGDGVNDSPALKAADIGVAVGSGTDVAKGAADLVLLDNNFETIVAAVEEGRRIIGNVKKVIIYLLSDSLDELFLIGGAIVAGVALPLNALQILWVNFFSDSFPAIAFAFEKGGNQLQKDTRSGKTIFDTEMKFLILVIGLGSSALLFGMYLFLLGAGFEENLVRSFIFATFATYTLFLAFSLRHLNTGILHYNPFGNLYLTGGVAFGVLLTLGALYLPFLGRILGTSPLPPLWLLGVFGFSILNLFAVELTKLFFRKK